MQNRLPFGISSAPEICQRQMTEILGHREGVVCHMDDIIVHAAGTQTHDDRVRSALQTLQEAGLTLNDKCEFSKSSVTFLGHIISSDGIQADPRKTSAITDFPAPKNVTEVQRFLGMTDQMAKFAPQLAALTDPLQLLKKDAVWTWGPNQEKAFAEVKEHLTTTPVLAHYSPHRQTVIAADASNRGLGAVLLQIQEDGTRRPVSYISLVPWGNLKTTMRSLRRRH